MTIVKMLFRSCTIFAFLLLAFLSLSQVHASSQRHDQSFEFSSPFASALEILQKQIGYKFQKIDLLRRAMTHASFSEENNKALSVLGSSVIEASVALRSLIQDIDISSKELNLHIAEISKVDSSCAVDGMKLGLQKVIRVSPKTDPSAPAVACGAFRAIFGAIALDSGKSDDAGTVFWNVHRGEVGRAIAWGTSEYF